jgi:putative ATP-binding cassette transporter
VKDEDLKAALDLCQLPQLKNRLEEIAPWSHMLSLGEQQRIAFLRALITKPDVIFLDEASSALDEAAECYFYKLLRQRLPAALIFSVGHRSTLQALHDNTVQMPNAAA